MKNRISFAKKLNICAAYYDLKVFTIDEAKAHYATITDVLVDDEISEQYKNNKVLCHAKLKEEHKNDERFDFIDICQFTKSLDCFIKDLIYPSQFL